MSGTIFHILPSPRNVSIEGLNRYGVYYTEYCRSTIIRNPLNYFVLCKVRRYFLFGTKAVVHSTVAP
jgi:hypothetical protein